MFTHKLCILSLNVWSDLLIAPSYADLFMLPRGTYLLFVLDENQDHLLMCLAEGKVIDCYGIGTWKVVNNAITHSNAGMANEGN